MKDFISREFKIGDIVEVKYSGAYIVKHIEDGYICVSDSENNSQWISECGYRNVSILSEEKLRDKFCLMVQDDKFTRWVPSFGEGYYYIDNSYDAVLCSSNNGYCNDELCLRIFNCFPTKWKAREIADKLKKIFKECK